MELIIDLLKLNFAIILILFLPGFFLIKALGQKRGSFFGIETAVLSFAASIAIADFLFILLNKFSIPINPATSVFFPMLLAAGLAIFWITRKKNIEKEIRENTKQDISFWKTAAKGLLMLIVFAFAIKTLYLVSKPIPQTTDMGHHMYWANYIITNNQLPDFEEKFIIGEHIIFGVVGTISGISVVSAMPQIILFLVNTLSLFALALVGYEVGRNITGKKNAFSIAVLVFFAIGILYSISSPQAKYISGGVIGNLIGNLLIPLLVFSFLKALRTKKAAYPAIFGLLLLALIYTHHLSTLIFLYISVGFALIFLLILAAYLLKEKNKKEFLKNSFSQLKIFLNWKYLASMALLVAIAVFSRIPSYLNLSAVDTAIGEPSKSTRTGLTLINLSETGGPWRFLFAGVGIVFLFVILAGLFFKKDSVLKKLEILGVFDIKKMAAASFAIAWIVIISGMSLAPDVFKLDIPSGRVATYATYAFALGSGIGIFYLLKMLSGSIGNRKKLLPIFFLMIFGTAVVSGLGDISEFYEEEPEPKITSQVFTASQFLKDKTIEDEIILKDHIYMPADTWVKIFLMRDYENPLSRSLMKRYNDPTKDRETCTRDMVAVPDSEIGQKCFQETETGYIMLQKDYDTEQFEKSPNFSKVFSGPDIFIYQRNN